MRMDLTIGRRVLKNGLVLATTIITCTALQANEQDNQSSQNSGAPQSSERATGASGSSGSSVNRSQSQSSSRDLSNTAGRQSEHGSMTQEQFVQKTLKSNQMEVQMGQLAQSKGQNQQVKQLGQRLVEDHSQAGQQLQQIAQKLNISASQQGQSQTPGQGHDDKHQQHQQQMSKLQNQSGAEFDKEFIRMAVKHHKKDISEFERAQQSVQNDELKTFISQTLPKLRQHLQMAQAAATSVGLDASTLASDEPESDTAVGAPAGTQTGGERPRSSIETDLDKDSSASASVDVDTDTDTDSKLFKKGDGKVLGLPTSNNDGTYLGIIPKPGANRDADATIEADVDTDTDASVGGAARSETGSSTDRDVKVDVDVDKE